MTVHGGVTVVRYGGEAWYSFSGTVDGEGVFFMVKALRCGGRLSGIETFLPFLDDMPHETAGAVVRLAADTVDGIRSGAYS